MITKINKATRLALSSSVVALALGMAMGPVAAQTAPAEGGNDDVIIVTGSRISSPGLTSASPLTVTSAAAIESTGAANLQDVLLQSPVFGTPSISRTNSAFSTSGAGISTVDLRNLGVARTLVLVNGRRFVTGLATDQAVDLNTIPTQFIDQVQVLTGGASAIYGSDAVAGVVNIIYKKDFEGIEMGAQMGVSEEGDDTKRQLNLTIGGNFADGKGNIMAYAGYTRDGSVLSRNRARSAIDQTDTGAGVTGDPNDFFTVTRPFFSSFAPQGRFFGAGGVTIGTFDANNNFINGFSTNGTATRAANGFNRSFFRTIAIPVERFLMATRANYEISSAANVFLEGTFAKSHTKTIIEPFAIQTAGSNGIFQGSGGFFPVEQQLANGTIFANPFVPAALLSQLTDVDGDGLRDVSFSRRLTDIDVRSATADRTTYRIVAGINGEFMPNWNYETFINYGRTDDNQRSTGQVNLANFRSALVVTQDAGGNLVCADVQARAQGCVPVNVFGANTISPAAAQYIRADGNRQAYASQLNAGASVNGSLGDFWGAGAPIGVALGVEYRKEKSAAINDALTQAGLNGGNAIPNTSGQYDVKEAYGELLVPIIADKPFFRSLDLRAAGRVSKYSTIGTVYSWNIGGNWKPTSDILFRATRARATRAPNVAELFSGLAQTFPTGLTDPCENLTAGATGTLADTCRSFPGVNANIAANGVFTVNQADRQGISGFDGGNPNLREEKGETFTAGVVITPRSIDALKNFTLSVDYSRTKIKGAIVQTPRQFILQQCFQAGDPVYCQFITRRAGPEGANSPGSLEFINAGQTNSGGQLTSSVDVELTYRQNLDNIGLAGVFDAGLQYTRLLKGYLIPLPGAGKDYFAGEVGASKDRFLLTANYAIGAVSIQYRGTYIGAAYLDDQFVTQFSDVVNGVDVFLDRHDKRAKIKAKYYSDLQVKWETGDHFEFYLGVNNLFDTSPPPIYSNLPFNTTGAETDSGTYDAIGRRFYAGARIKF